MIAKMKPGVVSSLREYFEENTTTRPLISTPPPAANLGCDKVFGKLNTQSLPPQSRQVVCSNMPGKMYTPPLPTQTVPGNICTGPEMALGVTRAAGPIGTAALGHVTARVAVGPMVAHHAETDSESLERGHLNFPSEDLGQPGM